MKRSKRLIFLMLCIFVVNESKAGQSPYDRRADEFDSSSYSDDKVVMKRKTVTQQRNKNNNVNERYTPDWNSLDSRPLPDWYDDAKFGIFIHWGLYSVPSFSNEWFWEKWVTGVPQFVDFMKKNYPPGFQYQNFAPQFTAEFFDPNQWADIFKSSGAKYVVLTSKHHEGYTLWPSKHSWNWNSVDVGPNRDLVGDLADAIRNSTDLKFGLYHSLMEWYNPIYLNDQANNWTTQNFVTSKLMPEMHDMIERYKPSVIWTDGDWEPNTYKYWNTTEFLAWLYNDSPVKNEVVVNDRWGIGTVCEHGDFFTCSDRFFPGTLQSHKWENCFTIDRYSWGYRRNANIADFFTTSQLIRVLARTISCGGNLLLNVGPTHDGKISPIFEERLRDIGRWLKINGEAVYGSKPWVFQNDTVTPNIWYTEGNVPSVENINPVYAMVFFWPTNENQVVKLFSPIAGPKTNVTFLGYSGSGEIKWEAMSPNGIEVTFPPKFQVSNEWTWVLRLDNLVNK